MTRAFRFPPTDVYIPYPEDFVISAQGVSYLFYSEKLAVFSPVINNLFRCDPTVRSIQFPFPDTKKQFPLIKAIVNGGSLDINSNNIEFLSNAASFFQNPTLLNAISQYNVANGANKILEHLSSLKPPIYDFPAKFFEDEIEFVASNFEQLLSNHILSKFPVYIYDAIFSSPSFPRKTLNLKLYDFVKKLVDKDVAFSSLFAHIDLLDLPQATINEFLDSPRNDQLNGSLLFSVLSIQKATNKTSKQKVSPPPATPQPAIQPEPTPELLDEVQTCEPKKEQQTVKQEPQTVKAAKDFSTIKNAPIVPYTEKVVEVPSYLQIDSRVFSYSRDDPFNGIFNYISRDGNPQYRGYVSMKSAIKSKNKYLSQLITYHESHKKHPRWNNYYNNTFTKDTQWLIIRFLIYKVKLTHYSICIYKDKSYYSQMKHWKLYASNDGANWDVIDDRDTNVLNYPNVKCNFEIRPTQKFYTYFKIEQLENFTINRKSNLIYEFGLSLIEFFGELQKL